MTKFSHDAGGADLRAQDEALYRFLLESLTECAVFAVTPDGRIMSWNAGAARIFGYAEADAIGRSFEIIFTPQDVLAGAPRTELSIALANGETQFDRWHVRKNGSRFWGTNTVSPLYGPHGALHGFTKLVKDGTAAHLAGEALRDSEQQLRLLVESVRGYAIFSLDGAGRVTTWSPGAQSIFGYPAAEIVGRDFAVLFNAADNASGRPQAELRSARARDSADVERWLVRKDATTFLGSGKTSRLEDGPSGELRGFVKLVHDTTQQHVAAQELQRKAQFDELTALPNRATFYEHVARAISIVKRRSSTPFAVLFIDLDHFKAVNDDFGHIIADQVLALIARRLETCVRSEDIVARVGGDEFAILLNGIGGALDADDAAQRILTDMRQAVSTDVGDVFAAVSVGIAIGSAKYERPQDILRDADAAMYVAKSQGRARAVTFDESIGSIVRRTVDLTADLRHAIERDELRLAYQPVIRLADKNLVGFEAFVRWKHPRRGVLLPSEFIAQAEETNLIIGLDRWVLGRACAQLANWRTRKIAGPALQMSVNVSSKEFSRADFPAELRALIAEHGLEEARLRLEITEGTVLERSARSFEVLSAVRALGIAVDVDDFGTGYASLGALNHIVVDGLKIDWSFVTSRDAHHGWEIVESVISLAHKLGVVAIAEGVESEEQLRQLISLGCDFGQGHLFAPALGAVAAAAFLRRPGVV